MKEYYDIPLNVKVSQKILDMVDSLVEVYNNPKVRRSDIVRMAIEAYFKEESVSK